MGKKILRFEAQVRADLGKRRLQHVRTMYPGQLACALDGGEDGGGLGPRRASEIEFSLLAAGLEDLGQPCNGVFHETVEGAPGAAGQFFEIHR